MVNNLLETGSINKSLKLSYYLTLLPTNYMTLKNKICRIYSFINYKFDSGITLNSKNLSIIYKHNYNSKPYNGKIAVWRR